MPIHRLLLLCTLSACVSSCSSVSKKDGQALADKSRTRRVKTTAYTHNERDHLVHGTKTAAGGKLQYGEVRSAAADWSVYPVGTVFKIEGDPHTYEVDDYGSALVGTGTIDIYKPSRAAMREYGARNVNISVIKWGSYLQSLAILKPRGTKRPYVREMIHKLEKAAEDS